MDDFWKTFDLTQRKLELFVSNLDCIEKHYFSSEKENCKLFFNRFPFQDLVNVHSMDRDRLMLSVQIIDFFSDYEEFYDSGDGFNRSLEFILINLSSIARDGTEIEPLYGLLAKLLRRNIGSMDNTFKNIFDRERILEAMVKTLKLTPLRRTPLKSYVSILNTLLDCHFPDMLHGLIFELFNEFKLRNAVFELSVICKYILQRKMDYLHDSFYNVWEWLTEESPNLLINSPCQDTQETILQCLYIYLECFIEHQEIDPKVREVIDTFHISLMRKSSEICLLTLNYRLRTKCFKLLELVLVKFFAKIKLKNKIFDQLSSLPEQIEDWVKSNIDIFLCICHVCDCYSRMLWKARDVLRAINSCFYSTSCIIKPHVLKSMYYLYPKLTNDVNTDAYYIRMLGDDLLYQFTKQCTVSYLYSFDTYQLKWMLKKLPSSTKLTILGQWLQVAEDDPQLEKVLMSVLKTSNAETALLEIIFHHKYGEQFGLKSALFLQKIANYEVAAKAALMLPLTVDKPEIFQNLILAEPGIPVNSSDSIHISAILAAMMPRLDDSQVLKGACLYSCKLLAKNKDNPDIVKEFCKNTTNIHYLVSIVDEVDEETSIEIISLLKLLVRIQQRHYVKLERTLTVDFTVFFKGSTKRVEKSMLLFYHTLPHKYSLITPDEEGDLALFHKILDYTTNTALQHLAHECIAMLYRKRSWLVQTVSSYVYVERACSTFSGNRTKSLLKMMDAWLRVLEGELYNELCPALEIAMKNFFRKTSLCNETIQTYLQRYKLLFERQQLRKTNGKRDNSIKTANRAFRRY